MPKPKSIAEVVRHLVAEAELNGTSEYVFRSVTYAAKVGTTENGKKFGEVWKIVGGERRCVDGVFRAGFETLPHGDIDMASGRSDWYNSVYFNKDGSVVPAGTWRR